MTRRRTFRRTMLVLAVAGTVAAGVGGSAGCGSRPGRPADAAAPSPSPPEPGPPTGSPAVGASSPPAAGAPSADPGVADLTPDTDGLRLARPVNGIRHGELVVTIRNNGPAPVRRLHFSVEVPESMSRDTGDWAGCTDLVSHRVGFPAGAICEKGPLASGETATFRLGMTSPAARDGADSRISRWLIDVWAAEPGGGRTPDAHPEDNRRIFSVYRD